MNIIINGFKEKLAKAASSQPSHFVFIGPFKLFMIKPLKFKPLEAIVHNDNLLSTILFSADSTMLMCNCSILSFRCGIGNVDNGPEWYW